MMELTINDSNTIENIKDLGVASSIFCDMLEKMENLFIFLQFELKDTYLYYKRSSDSNSILAIQVINGDYKDPENYMINFGKRLKSDKTTNDQAIRCKVGFQADAKASQRAMKIANYLARDIVDFFEQIELTLCSEKQTEQEIEMLIPLKLWRKQNILEGVIRRIRGKLEKRGY